MDKTTLRRQFRQQRKSLTPDEVQERSKLIAERFFDFLAQDKPINTSVTVHIFLPIERQNEVNTWPIIHGLWVNYTGVNVVAPFTDASTNTLRHYPLSLHTQLVENAWGIPEPATGDQLVTQPVAIDMVLVPLLLFDQRGHRVGYGGGYYDRFLAECRPDCLKLGLSLFEPIDHISDTEPTDVPLDMCITPEQVWIF